MALCGGRRGILRLVIINTSDYSGPVTPVNDIHTKNQKTQTTPAKQLTAPNENFIAARPEFLSTLIDFRSQYFQNVSETALLANDPEKYSIAREVSERWACYATVALIHQLGPIDGR